MVRLDELGDDLLQRIVAFLDVQPAAALRRTCRALRRRAHHGAAELVAHADALGPWACCACDPARLLRSRIFCERNRRAGLDAWGGALNGAGDVDLLHASRFTKEAKTPLWTLLPRAPVFEHDRARFHVAAVGSPAAGPLAGALICGTLVLFRHYPTSARYPEFVFDAPAPDAEGGHFWIRGNTFAVNPECPQDWSPASTIEHFLLDLFLFVGALAPAAAAPLLAEPACADERDEDALAAVVGCRVALAARAAAARAGEPRVLRFLKLCSNSC